jgi:hypothetical protein
MVQWPTMSMQTRPMMYRWWPHMATLQRGSVRATRSRGGDGTHARRERLIDENATALCAKMLFITKSATQSSGVVALNVMRLRGGTGEQRTRARRTPGGDPRLTSQ